MHWLENLLSKSRLDCCKIKWNSFFVQFHWTHTHAHAHWKHGNQFMGNDWLRCASSIRDCSEWILTHTHTHTGNVCFAYSISCAWCVLGVCLPEYLFESGIYRLFLLHEMDPKGANDHHINICGDTKIYPNFSSKGDFYATDCRNDGHDDKIIMMMMVSAYKGIATIVVPLT